MDIRQFTKHDEFSDGLHLEENFENTKTTTRNITLHFKFCWLIPNFRNLMIIQTNKCSTTAYTRNH